MAPVRRYLRISKYSVLECRIYLDNPALAQSWLLNLRNPVLPRVIESIRPLILPKLREEKERGKKKSSKKKSIKDVIVKGMTHEITISRYANLTQVDDFEVSMFLTETATRHSLLVKHKHFHDRGPAKLHSNSSKLTGGNLEDPVDVDSAEGAALLREEDSDEDALRLADIPSAESKPENKRRRGDQMVDDDFQTSDHEDARSASAIEIDSDVEQPPSKRLKGSRGLNEEDLDDDDDDKKKLAMDVSYEGFAIYGRVLCLVVKRRESNKLQTTTARNRGAPNASGPQPAGQARMENWITSTQVPVGEDIP